MGRARAVDTLLGAGAVVGAVALLGLALAAGWWLIYRTNLRSLPVVQELLGHRRQSPAHKAAIAAEIAALRHQHSRRGPRRADRRRASAQ